MVVAEGGYGMGRRGGRNSGNRVSYICTYKGPLWWRVLLPEVTWAGTCEGKRRQISRLVLTDNVFCIYISITEEDLEV